MEATMRDVEFYAERRAGLIARYLAEALLAQPPVETGGVDHLALICSDLDATIRFYTEMLGMRLARIVSNRDDPTSTHIFFDMGGGNQLAFFDFPEHGPDRTVRGVGSMHHVALRVQPTQYAAIVERLKGHSVEHSIHGSSTAGSVYLRDPDGILVELTTGY
jgi:catechol 2,3-dioxygenase-like lactoylglutathione lyase family enzyme